MDCRSLACRSECAIDSHFSIGRGIDFLSWALTIVYLWDASFIPLKNVFKGVFVRLKALIIKSTRQKTVLLIKVSLFCHLPKILHFMFTVLQESRFVRLRPTLPFKVTHLGGKKSLHYHVKQEREFPLTLSIIRSVFQMSSSRSLSRAGKQIPLQTGLSHVHSIADYSV